MYAYLSHFSPHGTLKNLRIDSVQPNWLIRAHFGLLKVTEEHGLEHRTARSENQLVTLEVLQKISLVHANIKCKVLLIKSFADKP
jgi:hypothetical protein